MWFRDTAQSALKRSLLACGRLRPLRPGLRVLSYHVFPPPQIFRQHLTMLRTETQMIGEAELLELVERRRDWPTSQLEVLITADDGYECQFTNDYNELFAEFAANPIVFLIGAALAPESDPLRTALGIDEQGLLRPLVTTASLRRGLEAGWSVGGHTQTHRDLGDVRPDAADAEVKDSADLIERELGVNVSTFAWPWGRREQTCEAAFKAVRERFVAAFSTEAGASDCYPSDAHFIRRDVVDSNMSAHELRGLIGGGLDRVRSKRLSQPASLR